MGTKREHMGVMVCGNNEASKHEFNKLDCPPHLVLLQEHHLNKDECLKFVKVMEFKNGAIIWNPTIQLGRSLR
jgi:hypothetical protein